MRIWYISIRFQRSIRFLFTFLFHYDFRGQIFIIRLARLHCSLPFRYYFFIHILNRFQRTFDPLHCSFFCFCFLSLGSIMYVVPYHCVYDLLIVICKIIGFRVFEIYFSILISFDIRLDLVEGYYIVVSSLSFLLRATEYGVIFLWQWLKSLHLYLYFSLKYKSNIFKFP